MENSSRGSFALVNKKRFNIRTSVLLRLHIMTQEERWLNNYNEVKAFIETNRRNLSKYDLEERRLYTWLKHNRKILNADGMSEPRLSLFRELLELSERCRRVNQWK